MTLKLRKLKGFKFKGLQLGKVITKAKKLKIKSVTQKISSLKKKMKTSKPSLKGAGVNQPKKGKFRRSKSERRKALLRDANTPNSKLDQKARNFIKQTNGHNVPNGYEVSHKKPLYTQKTVEGKKALDKAANMETIPKKVHRAEHKQCGITFHKYPR